MCRYKTVSLGKVIDTFVRHSKSRVEAVEELTSSIEVMLGMRDGDGVCFNRDSDCSSGSYGC